MHGWFPELQRQLALAFLNDDEAQSPYVFEIDRVGGSLLRGFEIQGLRVRTRRVGADADAATTNRLSIQKLDFVVDLPGLYASRRVQIERLDIEGVIFDWVESDDAEAAAPPPTPTPETRESEAPWTLAIDDLRVRDGLLRATLAPERGTAPFAAAGSANLRGLEWVTDGRPPRFDDFAADLRLLDVRVGPVRVESGRARLAGTPGAIELRVDRVQAAVEERGRLHLSGAGQAHFADGSVNLDAIAVDGVALDLSFTQLDLSALDSFVAAGDEAEGHFDLPQTRLDGAARLTRPEAWQLDFTLDPSEVAGLVFERGGARLGFDPSSEIWHLEQSHFEAQGTHLSLEGRGHRDRIEELSLEARGFPLAVLQRIATSGQTASDWPAVSGSVDVVAQLAGGPDHPTGTLHADGLAILGEHPSLAFAASAQLEADGSLVLETAEVEALEAEDRIATRGASRWRVEQGTASTDALVLELHKAGKAAGRVSFAKCSTDGSRHAVAATFEDFAVELPFALLGEAPPLVGSANGEIELDTQVAPARLVSDLVIEAPAVDGFAFDRLDIATTTEGPLWRWESRLTWNGLDPLSLVATIPGDGAKTTLAARLADPRTKIDLTLADLDLAHLAPLLPEDWFGDDALAGRLAGAFRLHGSPDGPRVSGDLSWDEARLGTARADRVALEAETVAERLELSFDITHQGRSALSARAKLELARLLEEPAGFLFDPQNQSVVTAEDVDLAWLVPRASARRLGRVEAVEGRASGRVEVGGSPDGPVIDGRLEVERAKLELALFDEPIGPIRAKLRFDNRSLQVEKLVIASTRGDAVVKGSYRWPGSQRADEVKLAARFDKFNLTHFPLFEARVSGDLRVTGPLTALDAKGDLAFRRVHVSLPAPQDPLLREVRILGLESDARGKSANAETARPSAYESMQAQIAIDVRRGAQVRERGVDLEAEGQILLRKRRLSPMLMQGTLATTGGTYTFFGRTFEVREGVATFEERLPPDPDLRIEATRQIGDVTVGVRRVGRWSEPAAELFSEPEMEETDILSYLMFNKPRSELGAADDSQLNAATAQVASNLALAELTRALSAELPINEITMEVGEDMTVSSVGVETNVGEDIIIRYDRALQDGVGDRFTVEWRFWKNLSLQSEYAEGGASGLDLFWSYEY